MRFSDRKRAVFFRGHKGGRKNVKKVLVSFEEGHMINVPTGL